MFLPHTRLLRQGCCSWRRRQGRCRIPTTCNASFVESRIRPSASVAGAKLTSSGFGKSNAPLSGKEPYPATEPVHCKRSRLSELESLKELATSKNGKPGEMEARGACNPTTACGPRPIGLKVCGAGVELVLDKSTILTALNAGLATAIASTFVFNSRSTPHPVRLSTPVDSAADHVKTARGYSANHHPRIASYFVNNQNIRQTVAVIIALGQKLARGFVQPSRPATMMNTTTR